MGPFWSYQLNSTANPATFYYCYMGYQGNTQVTPSLSINSESETHTKKATFLGNTLPSVIWLTVYSVWNSSLTYLAIITLSSFTHHGMAGCAYNIITLSSPSALPSSSLDISMTGKVWKMSNQLSVTLCFVFLSILVKYGFFKKLFL